MISILFASRDACNRPAVLFLPKMVTKTTLDQTIMLNG